MPKLTTDPVSDDAATVVEAGPRGILRVPEVLVACASTSSGGSLAGLSKDLDLPKTTLHRMLRTLERGGYLVHGDGRYMPGPASFHMARLIARLQPSVSFPESAQPTIERLARETGQSVTLGNLSDDRTEIVWVAAIDSTELLRYTLPVGGRRPLFSSASGKAVLSFMPESERDAYVAKADFQRFTPFTTRRDEMPALIDRARHSGVIYDRNGNFEGAGAIASPIFDDTGSVFASISIAGPTERLDSNRTRFERLCRAAAEQISRAVGFAGAFPPRD